MKLITFIAADGSERVGAIVGDGARVADLTLAQGSQDGFRDMLCLIDAGPAGLEAAQGLAKGARHTLALADLRLEAPIPVPRRLRWVFGGDWIVVGRRALSVGGGRVVKKKKS
jgi:hypothetical protein